MKILFNYLEVQFKLEKEASARKIIEHIAKEEEKKLGEITIVFTNNDNILSINKAYLKHSYYTDVIAFGNNQKGIISGDIIISVEQVALNARKYNTAFLDELFRVIIHGILHLIGYIDVNEHDRLIMKSKEEQYLQIMNNMIY